MSGGGVTLKKGEILTIDGGNGQVMAGAVPMVKPELTGEFAILMQWADGVRRMKVRTNAETPLDARTARGFGAEGIGLCRTEHMFFEGERIVAVREMILADNEAGRRAALAKLLPIPQARRYGKPAGARASRSKRPDAAQGLDALVGNPALAQDRLASRARRGDFG